MYRLWVMTECPIDAIKPESADLVTWLERAKIFIEKDKWPRITEPQAPLPNAEEHKNEKGKFEKYIK